MNKDLSHIGIAMLQMNSRDSVEHNIQQILDLLSKIKPSDDVSLVCLPENSLYMRIQEGEKVKGLSLENPALKKIIEVTKQKKLWIHFGSFPLDFEGALRNASLLYDPNGNLISKYFKIHLFDITLDGQPPMRESDVYKRGDEPSIFNIANWSFGQTICYDLRFAELYNWYAQHLVNVIMVPASFLVPTGKVHWEILLRARAIESQAYIIATAQAGMHLSLKGEGRRETYGRSMIIDPWGQIIAEAKTLDAELIISQLSLDRIKKVRTQIPMENHRRLVHVKK